MNKFSCSVVRCSLILTFARTVYVFNHFGDEFLSQFIVL